MHQYLGTWRAKAVGSLLNWLVRVQVDEIGNHLDAALVASKRAICLVTQVIRHRGYRIRALNSKFRDGKKRLLFSDERNISSMQCCNDLQRMILAGHLTGQERRRCMGYGVVDMKHVQPFTQRHLMLFHCKRQRIREVLQEGIGRADVDGVEIDVLRKPRQPKGRGIGNDVYLMAPLGQFEPQLGGHCTGSSVRGITSNPNAHQFSLSSHNSTTLRAKTFGGSVASNVTTGCPINW